MSQKTLMLVAIILLSAACGALAFQGAKDFTDQIKGAKTDELPKVAQDIVHYASINAIGSRGATEVSQVMDESRIQMDLIVVQQNQEIIRLLRRIAGEK